MWPLFWKPGRNSDPLKSTWLFLFKNEELYGYITHYAIGVGLALIYVLGWSLLIGGSASPLWALAYGVATTAASYFLVYPSMGLGVCGRRSPEGIKSPLSSLANHLFYGCGLAVAVALA